MRLFPGILLVLSADALKVTKPEVFHQYARNGEVNLMQSSVDMQLNDGSIDTVRRLPKRKDGQFVQDPTGETEEFTALRAAAENGQYRAVEWLLTNGANPNIVIGDDLPRPLYYAVASGNVDMTDQLLKYKADYSIVDKSGNTYLNAAIRSGNAAVVKKLIEAAGRADATKFVNRGNELPITIGSISPAIMKELVDAGADVNVMAEHNGVKMSPLMIALETCKSADHAVALVDILLPHAREHVNTLSSDGKTALNIANDKGWAKAAGIIKAVGEQVMKDLPGYASKGVSKHAGTAVSVPGLPGQIREHGKR